MPSLFRDRTVWRQRGVRKGAPRMSLGPRAGAGQFRPDLSPLVVAIVIALKGLLPSIGPASAQGFDTDLNIVVAFDRSESVTTVEATAQIEGLIYALAHPRLIAAIEGGFSGRIGLSVITWSSFGHWDVLLPWTMVGGPTDVARIVPVLEQDHRDRATRPFGPQTDVAFGLERATHMGRSAPFAAPWTALNIVSDGISNLGRVPMVDRDRALAEGMTVNALTFGRGSAERVLRRYFERYVIGGPRAFVVSALSPEQFAQATLRKMLLEIALLADLAVLDHHQAG